MTNLKTIRLDDQTEEHGSILDSGIDIRTFDDAHILTFLENMLSTIPDLKWKENPYPCLGVY
jgi:hypothetical protein